LFSSGPKLLARLHKSPLVFLVPVFILTNIDVLGKIGLEY
jgi:hypothetical protein